MYVHSPPIFISNLQAQWYGMYHIYLKVLPSTENLQLSQSIAQQWTIDCENVNSTQPSGLCTACSSQSFHSSLQRATPTFYRLSSVYKYCSLNPLCMNIKFHNYLNLFQFKNAFLLCSFKALWECLLRWGALFYILIHI